MTHFYPRQELEPAYEEHERGWDTRNRDRSADVGRGGFQRSQPGRRRGGHDSGQQAFLKRTAEILQCDQDEIRERFSAPEEKAFRLNSIRFDDQANPEDEVKEILAELEEDGISTDALGWFNGARIFSASQTEDVQGSRATQSGKIFIQNPSSYLPVFALLGNINPEDDARILDLCAAPGGKSAMIADLTQKRTSQTNITANDVKGQRNRRMQEVFSLLGIGPELVQVAHKDGRHLVQEFGGGFSAILVDAECSTDSGINFASRKDPLGGWSMERVERLVVLQKKLARVAYDGIEPGGTMVYSTCTLSPEENEGVITSMINRYPDAIIKPLIFGAEETTTAIKKWHKDKYPDRVAEGILRIAPNGYMGSFCLAVVHKPTGNDKVDKKLAEPLQLEEVINRLGYYQDAKTTIN